MRTRERARAGRGRRLAGARSLTALALVLTLATGLHGAFCPRVAADLSPDVPPEPCAPDAPGALCTWLRSFSQAPTLEALAARVGPAGIDLQGVRYADAAALRAAVPSAGTRGEAAALRRLLAFEGLYWTVTRGACEACPHGAVELVCPHGWHGSGSVRVVFASSDEAAPILRWRGTPSAL